MKNYEQELFTLLELVAKQNASDLHISAGRPPTLRIDGGLVPVREREVLSPEDTEGFMRIILTEEQQEKFKKNKSIDLSYTYKDIARFRVNVFYQFGTISIALRFIPSEIRTVEELNLPDVLHRFPKLQQGFVLITGPVGHGKSTTLAALIDEINKTRTEHIITIEDPVEYVFDQNRSMIDQREVGKDTHSFSNALRTSFRQDPDVIMLGEMRDAETMETAMTAAETGHLILATLHTNNAPQTIDRIIDSFPPGQQTQIRAQLALTIAGIVSQRLVPRLEGGRIPVTEVLLATPAVRNLIRERKTHEINMVIETNADMGMISMNRHLAELVRKGEISRETAQNYSLNPNALQMLLNE